MDACFYSDTSLKKNTITDRGTQRVATKIRRDCALEPRFNDPPCHNLITSGPVMSK